MADNVSESDKSLDKPDVASPSDSGAAKEAETGTESYTGKVKQEREKTADRNDSIWGALTGMVSKVTEKLTITGLEGKSGKVAAPREATEKKMAPSGERPGKGAPLISGDSGGQARKHEYPGTGNRLAQFKFDDLGRLAEAYRPDGTTWKRNDKGTYDVYDLDGKLVRRNADPQVEKDGTFAYDGADKSGRTGRHEERPDGTTSVKFSDSSRYEKDAQGRITEVEYATKPGETRGPIRRFEYDGAGNVICIEDADGTYWSKPHLESDRWVQSKDAQGKRPTGRTWDGNVSVNQGTGEYAYTGPDGTRVSEAPDRSNVTIHADKSSLVERPDGSRVERDSLDRITGTTYPPRPGAKTGESRKYEYDRDGNIKALKDRDGSYWVKGAQSDRWTQFTDESGRHPTGRTREAHVEVDGESGEYVYTESGKNVMVIESTDGTRTTLNTEATGEPDGSGLIEKPDGSRISVNKDGRAAEVIDAYGRSSPYKNDDDGNTPAMERQGESETPQSKPDELPVSAPGPQGQEGAVQALSQPIETALSQVEVNGRFFSSADGATWTTVSGEIFKGTVDKLPDGTLRFRSRKGESLFYPDGRKVVIDSAGGCVTYFDGLVRETVNSKGKRQTYEYDKDGNLCKFVDEDERLHIHAGGRMWTVAGSSSPEVDTTYQVHSDGSLSRAQNDCIVVTRLDGRREIHVEGKRPRVTGLDIDVDRSALLVSVDYHFSGSFNKTMREGIRAAEERMGQAGASGEEVAEFFFHVKKMIDNGSIPERARKQFASTVVDYASHPSKYPDGLVLRGETDGTAARAYATHPLESAKVASGASVDGEYIGPDLKVTKWDTAQEMTLEPLSVKGERKALGQSLDGTGITAKQRHEVKRLLNDFESRMSKENLPPGEIVETYAAVRRLLDHKGDLPLAPCDLALVARDVLMIAANPEAMLEGAGTRWGDAVIKATGLAQGPADFARLTVEMITAGDFSGKQETMPGACEQGLPELLNADQAQPRVEIEASVLSQVIEPASPAPAAGAGQLDPASERAALAEAADERFPNPASRRRFEEALVGFEARAHGFPAAEMAAVYGHLKRLIDVPSGNPLSSADRLTIAEGILKKAANPEYHDDGPFGRWVSQFVSKDTYQIHPSEVLRLAADVTNGMEHNMSDGRLAQLTDERLARFSPRDLKAEYDALMGAAKSLPPQNRTRFRKCMEALRARERGLPPYEVAETYAQVRRLLEARADAPLPQAERARLGEQVMWQAAYPHQIDQGYNCTCNVAVVEKRIYSRSPAEAARLIAEVATNGKYTSADGFVVNMEIVPGGITPDKEAARALMRPFRDDDLDLKGDGHRSHASQLFQMTAVNSHWQRMSGVDEFGNAYKAGDIRYELRTPVDNADTGESLMSYAHTPPRPIRPGALFVSDEHIFELIRSITGQPERGFVIANERIMDRRDAASVSSPQALADKLQALKDEGRLPAVVKVHTENEPFFTDSKRGNAGGGGGFHVVVVDDIADGKVSVRNNWGRSTDHAIEGVPPNQVDNRISVENLFDATGVPPAAVPSAPLISTAALPEQGADDYVGAGELTNWITDKLGTPDEPKAAGEPGEVGDEEKWYQHQYAEPDSLDEVPQPDAGCRGEDVEPPDALPEAPAEVPVVSPDASAPLTRKDVDSVGGMELRLNQEMVIGSGANSSLRIGSSAVEYHHAKVRMDEGGNVYVEDLDSVGGTRVRHPDGTEEDVPPQREVKLEPGDQVLVGGVPLSVGSREVAIEQPVRTATAEAPTPRRVFHSETTAPKPGIESIAGVEARPGTRLTLGRDDTADVPIANPRVSARHAQVDFDANGKVYVTDLNSTNGTKIVHADGTTTKLEAGYPYELKPYDRLILSQQEIPVATRPRPSFAVKSGGRDIELAVGSESVFADGRFGVGPNDARLVMREDGLHIRALSDVPIFVNGRQVAAETEVPIHPRDCVAIGEPSRVVGGERQGEWLQLYPSDIDEVPRPLDAAADPDFQRSIAQSNEFAGDDEVSEPIADGFQAGGGRNYFQEDGDFEAPGERHAFVVDRQSDSVLNQVIGDAKRRFGDRDSSGRFKKLDPNDPDYAGKALQMASDLTDYVHDLYEPHGWSGSGQLDDWILGEGGFGNQHSGARVLLGEYIKQGKGGCVQQATTRKVLGDELGLNLSLVRGAGMRRQPDVINHAWVELRIPGETRPLVYDPRNNLVKAKPYGNQSIGFHWKGAEIEQELAAIRRAQAQEQATRDAWQATKDPADVSIGRQPLDIPEDGTVDIGRDSIRGTPAQKARVSRTHAGLTRHGGSVWLMDRSSNGTFINGVRVPRDEWVSIGPGDVVTLGAEHGPSLTISRR